MPTFQKIKTEFVLKNHGQSVEFPNYRSAMSYLKKFQKMFPEQTEIKMFKVVIYEPSNQLENER